MDIRQFVVDIGQNRSPFLRQIDFMIDWAFNYFINHFERVYMV